MFSLALVWLPECDDTGSVGASSAPNKIKKQTQSGLRPLLPPAPRGVGLRAWHFRWIGSGLHILLHRVQERLGIRSFGGCCPCVGRLPCVLQLLGHHFQCPLAPSISRAPLDSNRLLYEVFKRVMSILKLQFSKFVAFFSNS